jgi:hypothetical protein
LGERKFADLKAALHNIKSGHQDGVMRAFGNFSSMLKSGGLQGWLSYAGCAVQLDVADVSRALSRLDVADWHGRRWDDFLFGLDIQGAGVNALEPYSLDVTDAMMEEMPIFLCTSGPLPEQSAA